MARPRTFDADDALARARAALWAGGIHATSVAELSAATGLTVGSLYKAFADKPTLVRRALETYLDAGLAWTADRLGRATGAEGGAPGDENPGDRAPGDGARTATPLAGIETWLRAVAELAASDAPTRGCFAVQCAAELAERDGRVRERLAAHDAALRALVADELRREARAGLWRGDAELHARVLLTLVNGLQLDARKGLEARDAHAVVDAALAGLRAARPPP